MAVTNETWVDTANDDRKFFVDFPSDVESRCDLTFILNLHGGTRSLWLTLTSGARYRAGFAHHRFSFLYSQKIPTAQAILGVDRPVHTAEHLASAVFWLKTSSTAGRLWKS